MKLINSISLHDNINDNINDNISNNTIENQLNVLDLFCGCGGMSVGFMEAGYSISLGIDNVPIRIETYNSNGKKGLCGDIKEITGEYILKHSPKPNIIIGGPPCQGFSMAGKRDNKDPRNSLFMEYLKFVKYFTPLGFVMENVPGILTMKTKDGKLVIDIIKNEFNNIGYKIKYQKLLASDYDVPQNRRRVIFIGLPISNKNEITFPEPTHKGKHVPVSTVLSDEKEIDKYYFHSEKMISGFIKRKEENVKKGNGFGAQYLDFNKPSYTISARYWKDGADALVKYSDSKIIMLTEKEVSLIQSFPHNYIFKGSHREIYEQIGNAVPCLLVYNIAKHLKTLI